jgi:hypothetical protein
VAPPASENRRDGWFWQSRSTDFACYVKNYTDNAVRLNIPFGTLENAPAMTSDEHAAVIARNRQRYAATRDEPRPTATGPDTAWPTAAGPDHPLIKPPGKPTDPDKRSDDWRS